MDLVGPGFQSVTDDAAAGAAELGSVGIRVDAVFLDRVDSWYASRLIVVSRGIRGAIDQDVRGGSQCAVDPEGIGAAFAAGVGSGKAVVAEGHANAEVDELQRIPHAQRNALDKGCDPSGGCGRRGRRSTPARYRSR